MLLNVKQEAMFVGIDVLCLFHKKLLFYNNFSTETKHNTR